jgi:hypothetical protein
MYHPKVLVKEVRVVDHEDRVLGDCVGLERGSMEGRDRWSPWFLEPCAIGISCRAVYVLLRGLHGHMML